MSGENFSRFAQASTIINDKLYIIGGQLSQNRGSNDMIYLSLTESFDVREPHWIRTLGLPVESSWASAVAIKDDGILLYGGYTWDLNTHTLEDGEFSLYLFNTSTEEWKMPTTGGMPPIRREGLKMVSDNSNKIYIFGGVNLNDKSQWFNDMYVLDISDYSWQLVQMRNEHPYPRAYYTATMLPSGVIIYIGGSKFENGIASEVDLAEITIYDTKDASWYYEMRAGGDKIGGRNNHSAVLTSNANIIIYGGVDGSLVTASPVMAVLDTSALPYTWSSLETQDRPPPLMLHTADMYQNYMIVAFGNITDEPTQMNSEIYIFDINKHTWITSYSPNITTSNSSHGGHDSLGLILGIASAAIAFVVIFGVLGVFLYKRRESQQNVIATPGSDLIEEEGGGVMMNRDSVFTSNSNENYKNNSVIDDSIKPPSRRPSLHNINTNLSYPINGPSTSINNRPSTSSYVPHGGIGPNSPPYGSRR